MPPNGNDAIRCAIAAYDEKYNDGSAFKATCRTAEGVIVTLIADNYFGYCKKEVKTQISYAANLMGNVEEEHAGGALAFPSWSLGDEFQVNSQRYNGRTFADVERDYSDFVDVRPEGYGVDRFCDKLIYIPENAKATLYDQKIYWERAGKQQSISARTEQSLHGSQRLSHHHGEAPLGSFVAFGRQQRRWHRLPQTVYGQRWWQERN